MKKTQGFTLIELLVVIAIIGILSSVVLASLSGGRKKSYNARVKAQLSQARTAAEVYYQENYYNGENTYNGSNQALTGTAGCGFGMFGVQGTNAGMHQFAVASNYPGIGSSDIVCNSPVSGSSYSMSIKLPLAEGAINYWCLDSRGVIKGRAAQLPSVVSANCDS